MILLLIAYAQLSHEYFVVLNWQLFNNIVLFFFQILKYFDYFFTSVFAVEIALKVSTVNISLVITVSTMLILGCPFDFNIKKIVKS